MSRLRTSMMLVAVLGAVCALNGCGPGAEAPSEPQAAPPEPVVEPVPVAGEGLQGAVIVASASKPIHAKAAVMLQEEIEKRSGVRLSVSESMPAETVPAVVLATADEAGASPPPRTEVPSEPEGYAIWVDTSRGAKTVHLVGRDDRGVLFAAGRLILLLDMAEDGLDIADDTNVSTAPRYPMRGHQLGYRNTANSYDAWDLATYEQYVRDLILFGGNSIELIPSLDPEEKDGPVMEQTMWDMTVALSEMIGSYGLDVWFWLPLEGDVSDPEVAQQELDSRRALFESCPNLAAVMVPGGDPGHTAPEVLMPWLGRMAEVMHEVHPDATLWVSNQGFEHEQNDIFFDYLSTEQPDWLEGVVFGPWAKIDIVELRDRTPDKFKVRRYPDINHCLRCQYAMPKWDRAFAHTLGREPICPRPKAMAHIHNVFAPMADGFVTYSDGIHDDLNKFVWNAMGWNPDADVTTVLRDYGKAFFGQEHADSVALGMSMLEENWVGPIAENDDIAETLAHWETVAENCGEALSTNWRLQMHLFRALYDVYVQEKVVAEARYEAEAYEALGQAGDTGVAAAIEAARAALAQADEGPPSQALRERIQSLGLDLLESIGFQLSADEPYKAKSSSRGAVLDYLDRPLNNRPWLELEFEKILAEKDEAAQLASIDTILNWEDPGVGGFYDDLGHAGKQPHLVRQKTWEEDPGYVHSPQEEYGGPGETGRLSWQDQASTLFGTPLIMRYEGLETDAAYTLRVTYAGRFRATMTLVADGEHEIHGPMAQPGEIGPVEFDIPKEATSDGVLELEWQLNEKRGCQVAEVWLIKQEN